MAALISFASISTFSSSSLTGTIILTSGCIALYCSPLN
jgi:hypothetical protein